MKFFLPELSNTFFAECIVRRFLAPPSFPATGPAARPSVFSAARPSVWPPAAVSAAHAAAQTAARWTAPLTIWLGRVVGGGGATGETRFGDILKLI